MSSNELSAAVFPFSFLRAGISFKSFALICGIMAVQMHRVLCVWTRMLQGKEAQQPDVACLRPRWNILLLLLLDIPCLTFSNTGRETTPLIISWSSDEATHVLACSSLTGILDAADTYSMCMYITEGPTPSLHQFTWRDESAGAGYEEC